MKFLRILARRLLGRSHFDFLLDLPIIPSRTFQIQTDSSGNLFWTWDIPEQLLTLAKTYDLQYKAGVGAMVNGQNVALYWPNVPVEMGSSFALAQYTKIWSADQMRYISGFR